MQHENEKRNEQSNKGAKDQSSSNSTISRWGLQLITITECKGFTFYITIDELPFTWCKRGLTYHDPFPAITNFISSLFENN